MILWNPILQRGREEKNLIQVAGAESLAHRTSIADCKTFYIINVLYFGDGTRKIYLRQTPSYLDRLLDPLTEAFTPKMASALLELRADSELEAHIGELRRKANDGTLTPAEDAEYKDFVEAVDVISIMQAKARRFLARQSG
jgi:hypothetical protein